MLGGSSVMRLFRAVFREQKTRLKVDWLTHTDERIMEHLAAVEDDTPSTVAGEIDRSVEYVADRCRQLGLRGLIDPLDADARGADVTYRLSDLGKRYLAGDVDADELEKLAG